MTEFVTMYRRDYLWPPMRPYFPRTDLSCTVAVPSDQASPAPKPKVKACGCADNSDEPECLKCSPSEPPKPILKACGCVDKGDNEEPDCCQTKSKPGAKECGCIDRGENEEPDCCREEKLKSRPKIGPCPKTLQVEYEDTDNCLKKMLETNPNLISVMKKLPTFDAIKKFNLERLKSTYMVDYDKMYDPPGGDFADPPAKPVCPLDDPIPPKIDCRVANRTRKDLMINRGVKRGPKIKYPCEKKHPVAFVKKKGAFEEARKPQYLRQKMPPWTTEYRSEINSIAAEMMKEMRIPAEKRALLERRRRALEPPCEFDHLMLG